MTNPEQDVPFDDEPTRENPRLAAELKAMLADSHAENSEKPESSDIPSQSTASETKVGDVVEEPVRLERIVNPEQDQSERERIERENREAVQLEDEKRRFRTQREDLETVTRLLNVALSDPDLAKVQAARYGDYSAESAGLQRNFEALQTEFQRNLVLLRTTDGLQGLEQLQTASADIRTRLDQVSRAAESMYRALILFLDARQGNNYVALPNAEAAVRLFAQIANTSRR